MEDTDRSLKQKFLVDEKHSPLNDPEEALRFCQWLSKSLGSSIGTIESGAEKVNNGLAPESLTSNPILSIIVPIFNEEENIPVLYHRLCRTLEDSEPKFEIIFIDDGSQDHSIELLRNLANYDDRLKIIQFARNFGHQIAISAGMDYARGDAVVIMDADLQDPPEVIPQFIAKLGEGYDVVYAIRANRKEGRLKRAAYAVFYRLLQRIASIEIPLDAGDFCIMDRKVVNILIGMPERNRFVRGIRSWVGLDQVGLEYSRDTRYAGKPKYTFNRLLFLALDGLVSFSYIPLRMITMIGFIVSLISIVLAIGYTIQKITLGLNPPGFATLVVATFLLAGIQLTTLGVIGEYVGRIFEEVKHRPLYIVRSMYGLG